MLSERIESDLRPDLVPNGFLTSFRGLDFVDNELSAILQTALWSEPEDRTKDGVQR